MARKKLSLDAMVEQERSPAAVSTVPTSPEMEKPTKPPKPAYRENKRAFTAWANTDAYRQLKRMAADRDTTIQALLEEGMDLVFHKYGYDQIARS